MRTAVLLACLAALCAAPVTAQQRTPTERAALELLEVMNMPEVMRLTMEATMAAQIAQNPDMEMFADVMRDFLGRHMAWNRLRDRFVEMYARHFTLQELRDLTAFYGTSTGQKLARVTPELTLEASAIGERVVEENSAELQRLIMERLMELEDDS